MSTSLIVPAVQTCAFALGCAMIHSLRAHASVIAQLLTGTMIMAAVFVLLTITAIYAPNDNSRLDEITTYAAFAG